jgi:nucleoside-diphosphate-sugar epimerase
VVDAAAPYPTDVSPVDLAAVRARAIARQDQWLEAARQEDATFVYVGSFVTAPTPAGPLARFTRTARRALHPYFEVKRALEERVLEAAASGMRTVIVHPSTCLGPGDLRPRELCLVPRLASGELPVALSGVLNVVDVRDLAAVLLAAVERGPYGRPVPALGHDVTVEMLCTRVAQLAGVEPPRFVADGSVLRSISWSSDVLNATLGRMSPSASLAVALLREGRIGHPGSRLGPGARRLLRRRPISLSRTLVDSLAWAAELGQCDGARGWPAGAP